MTAPAWWPSEPLQLELDRVSVSMRTAGFADGVSVTDLGDFIVVRGTPRAHPRRTWRGSEEQAMQLLATLPDGAGVEAFWQTFT
jgi:hypothetical protein